VRPEGLGQLKKSNVHALIKATLMLTTIRVLASGNLLLMQGLASMLMAAD
jgi:hypothetical protein